MEHLSNEILVERYQNATDQAEKMDILKELYESNYLYFRKICNHYAVYGCIDDLMQESFFGLKIAADNYQQDREIPFINFAGIWIKSVVVRYVRNCSDVVRLPVHLWDDIYKFQKTVAMFEQEHGREPTGPEIRQILQLSLYQYKKLKKCLMMRKLYSIDKDVNDDNAPQTFADFLVDPEDHYEELTEQIDDDIKKRVLWDEVELLDDKKAEIIKRYYKDEMTYEAIGNELGITKERVRQLRNKALERLRRSRRIRAYKDEYISSQAYKGTGLRAFINTGQSSVERTVLDDCERELSTYIREIELREDE